MKAKNSSSRFLFTLTALVMLVVACGVFSPTEKPTEPAKDDKPLSGPLATAAALNSQVTLVPATPIGGFDTSNLTADDYVGIFKQAWHIVNANYYRDDFNGVDWDAVYDEYLPRAEKVVSSEELHQLLTDMVRELNDDHSHYTTYERTQAQYGFEAVDGTLWTGIDAWPPPGREYEYFTVWHVCSVGPAALAGIEKGDIILAVDGESLEPGPEGFEREHARAVMFGTGGDSATLTIQAGPDEAARDVVVKLGGASGCDDWKIEIISESPRIGYIRIPVFQPEPVTIIYDAIQDLEKDAPLDSLILDVRHNPGGFPDKSIGIFTKGIVGTQGPLRADKQRQVYRIRQNAETTWNDTTPVVVLIDGSSHSAADYFPAAMQELGRATIIGMNSAGNTDGYTSFILANSSIVHLAVTFLELNDGTNIEGVGVTPDVEVPLGMWGLKQQPYDLQVQAAIDFLSK